MRLGVRIILVRFLRCTGWVAHSFFRIFIPSHTRLLGVCFEPAVQYIFLSAAIPEVLPLGLKRVYISRAKSTTCHKGARGRRGVSE